METTENLTEKILKMKQEEKNGAIVSGILTGVSLFGTAAGYTSEDVNATWSFALLSGFFAIVTGHAIYHFNKYRKELKVLSGLETAVETYKK